MRTQQITLPSGIDCEVRAMTGKELSDLSNVENIRMNKALSKVLASCLVSLGEETVITENRISELTEPDYKCILFYCRILSYRLRPNVKFTLVWKNENGDNYSKTHEVLVREQGLEIKISDLWKNPVVTRHTWENPKNYGDILADRYITLPDSNLEVTFNVAPAESKVKVRGIGDAIMKRNPRYKDTNGTKSLDLDSLSADDYCYLYEQMVLAEGSIDTTAIVTNDNGEKQTVDLLGLQSFFFPFLAV